MLTRWLTLTAFLAGSVITGGAASGRRAVTFAPICRVKGQPEVELTLNCGDSESAGVVQYWHTPFGDLQTPGFHTKLDPVFMHHDGSLVISNSTTLHSGLYYCLLQSMDGTTLWQYELHVDPNNQNHHKHDAYKQSTRCAAVRFRRSTAFAGKKQANVSDGLFAGAVAASVLLTFVVGFSAGALSRTHVLRCFGAVTMRLQTPKRQPCQTDMPDHSSQVTMKTMPSTHHNQASESEGDSANCATMEMTTLTSLSPPAKPQRSFRHKREEEEATAYLEGCDHVKEEKGGGVEEIKDMCEREPKEKEREFHAVYLLEDEGNQTETDEDKHSEEREEEDGESTEGRMDGSLEEAAAAGEVESSNKEDGKMVRRDEDLEKATLEVKETEMCAELEQPSTETDERGSKNEDTTSDDITGEPSSSAPNRGRRSRVIRLYQYDEDGQRFCHLPDPTPEEQGPTPKLKQRSISLTRLSAIMAAASAGPLDQKETDRMESEERLQFHMEI